MNHSRSNGVYRDNASFQTATIIYDATVWFCEKFKDLRSPVIAEQMVQVARSGRQNIAEGSRASATSSQPELILLNVARASFEVLLLDYEDFLRQRRLVTWSTNDPEATAVRAVWRIFQEERTDMPKLCAMSDSERSALYSRWLEHADCAIRANALICLIHQANSLLDQQIAALEKAFTEGSGYSEQLDNSNFMHRQKREAPVAPSQAYGPSQGSGPSQGYGPSRAYRANRNPQCPQCGAPMAHRTVKSGRHAGNQFWGCTQYPDCRGNIPV